MIAPFLPAYRSVLRLARLQTADASCFAAFASPQLGDAFNVELAGVSVSAATNEETGGAEYGQGSLAFPLMTPLQVG